ncbi:MAG TPA: DUF6463 family protein [Propionibacteriaceae bacterium]
MRKWLSVLVIALGLVHVATAILADGTELRDLIRAGIGGLPTAPFSQVAVFYSVLFGVLAAAAGQVMLWAAVRLGTIPVVPGFVLIAVGLAGVLGAPRSPFWAAIVLGLLVIIVSRFPPDRVRTGGFSQPAPTAAVAPAAP